jgi:uncharacterized membrane protein YsdA (DUF1294 family)
VNPAGPRFRIAAALPRWWRPTTLYRITVATLFVVGATWTVTRFCGLDVSPPGFFMDEATPALDAMCLADAGKDHDGNAWPFFYTRAAGGGQHPLTLVGFEALWMKLFGTSRAAFRAVYGFWILLTSLGLFLLAREIAKLIPNEPGDVGTGSAKRCLPWLVLLAALLSPWSFQFSRTGWEGPVAPAYMVLALWALVRTRQDSRAAIVYAAFAGVCAAASMCTYPPLRVVVPLVLTLAGILLLLITPYRRWKWRFIKRAAVAAMVAVVLFAPTLRLLAKGSINQRMHNVAIWNDEWVAANIGTMDRRWFLVKAFLDNVYAHLLPSFLFVRGDASLRTSPQISGQLSPLDILALAFIAWLMLRVLVAFLRGRDLPRALREPARTSERWLVGVALFAIMGGFFGIAPSALTWDHIPNSLRAIGAWPFVALFTGAVLALAWSRRKWVTSAIAVVALVHTLHYLPAYFHAYDKAETHWFMRDMPDAIAKGRRAHPPKSVQQVVAENLGYMYGYDEVGRFYLMSEGKMKCDQAVAALQLYWQRARGR